MPFKAAKNVIRLKYCKVANNTRSRLVFFIFARVCCRLCNSFNPIPSGQERNQTLYEGHVTKSNRNRVKEMGQVCEGLEIWRPILL